MNLPFLNRPIGAKAILVSAVFLAVLFPLLSKLGTVDVSSNSPLLLVMFVPFLIFLVVISLWGASKSSNPSRALTHYLVIIGCGIVAGIVIYLFRR